MPSGLHHIPVIPGTLNESCIRLKDLISSFKNTKINPRDISSEQLLRLLVGIHAEAGPAAYHISREALDDGLWDALSFAVTKDFNTDSLKVIAYRTDSPPPMHVPPGTYTTTGETTSA